jgi:hypothetical protein
MEESFVLGFEAGLEKIAKKAKDDDRSSAVGYGGAAARGAVLGGTAAGALGAATGAHPFQFEYAKRKKKPAKGARKDKPHKIGQGSKGRRRRQNTASSGFPSLTRNRPTSKRILGGLKGAGLGAGVGAAAGAGTALIARLLLAKKKKEKKEKKD